MPDKWHYRASHLVESVFLLQLKSTADIKIGRITKKIYVFYNQKHMRSHKKLLKYKNQSEYSNYSSIITLRP